MSVLSLMRKPMRAANWSPFWRREIRFRQYRMQVPSFDRWLYVKLHALGLMGAPEFKFFHSHVKPGMTVVDVGANIGLYSLIMADLVGASGRVFAFEPSPTLFEAAEQSIRRNSREQIVRLENLGLGSKPGTAVLYRTGFNSGDNRLVSSSRHVLGVPVRIERLDDVLPDDNVDWIKIDVQGWEAEVLRGMEQTLRRNPSVRLYFEFWPPGLRHAAEDPAALLHWLNDIGFSVYHPGGSVPLSHENFLRLADARFSMNLVAASRQD